MATSTTDKPILGSTWTKIAGEALVAQSGFATLWGDNVVLYRQGTSPPPTTTLTGHKLQPSSDFFNFTLLAGEFLYMRSEKDNALVILTLDG